MTTGSRFGLLLLIGANMIKESFSKEEADERAIPSGSNTCCLLAIATSIDALAVGVTFAFLQVDIWKAVSFIGVVTFAFSVVGMKLGNVFGMKYKSKAEFAGWIDPDPAGRQDFTRALGHFINRKCGQKRRDASLRFWLHEITAK